MPEGLRQRVGGRIRSLRKARGWTQEELGRRCRLDYKYVGAIERAERNFPIDTLEKIALGLDVQPYSLFFFGDPGEPGEPAERGYPSARIRDLIDNSDSGTRRLLLAIFEDVFRYRPDGGDGS